MTLITFDEQSTARRPPVESKSNRRCNHHINLATKSQRMQLMVVVTGTMRPSARIVDERRSDRVRSFSLSLSASISDRLSASARLSTAIARNTFNRMSVRQRFVKDSITSPRPPPRRSTSISVSTNYHRHHHRRRCRHLKDRQVAVILSLRSNKHRALKDMEYVR